MYAFKTNKLDDESMQLAKEAVDYVGGLPLALTLLGQTFYGKSIDYKKAKLKECIENSYKPIQTILELSYDDLSEVSKAVFLDIACFFKGMHIKDVKKILTNYGYSSSELYIEELEDKSLIKVRQSFYVCDTLEMHDLIQKMGRQIVQRESVEAGERSRLWSPKDVCHVLEANTGTNKVQGIVVDLPEGGEIDLNPEAFKEMKNLKLLIVRNGRFSQAPYILPSELRVLEWSNYPGESLPPDFCGRKLAVLKMPNSNLTGLKRKNFKNLTTLDLKGSELLEVPSLSQAPNLVSIDLSYCTKLRKVDDSVGTLAKLSSFELTGYHELKFFPRSLECRSLDRLNLSKCPLISVCPEIKSEKLTNLGLGETSIEELSPSFRNLTGLISLDLSGSQKLKFLKLEGNKECGTSVNSTKVSEISPAAELLKLPAQAESSACNHENCCLSNFFCSTTSGPAFTLRFLYLDEINLVSLPECIIYLVSVVQLSLFKCSQLKEVSVVPFNLRWLYIACCKSLQRIHFNAEVFPRKLHIVARDCNSLSEGIWKDLWDLLVNARRPDNALHIQFSEREIPPWFSCFELSGLTSGTVVMKEPRRLKSEIRGIAFFFVHEEPPDRGGVFSFRVYVTSLGSPVYFATDDWSSEEVVADSTILRCHISDSFKRKLKGKGINVKVEFYCDDDCYILKCGVRLIYGHEQNTTDQVNTWRIDNGFNFEDYEDGENDDSNENCDSSDNDKDEDDENDDSNDDDENDDSTDDDDFPRDC